MDTTNSQRDGASDNIGLTNVLAMPAIEFAPPILLDLSFLNDSMRFFNRSVMRNTNFSLECMNFTHSNRPLCRSLRMPAEYNRLDPDMIDGGALIIARQAERERELRDLFLLQDLLSNRNLPNVSIAMIFQYIEKDPLLVESANELLHLRSSL